MPPLAVPALLLLASPLFAQGKLWVVDDDPGPGVDFQDIQSAVNAALEGDGILVRAGTYPEFTIDGKSLNVLGESGAQIAFAPQVFFGPVGVYVTNLGANQSVLIRGLEVVQTWPGDQNYWTTSGILSRDNEGMVWIEDVQTVAGMGGSAIGAVRSQGFVIVDSTAEAIAAYYDDVSVSGLSVFQSDAAAYGSSFSGGLGKADNGYYGTCYPGVPGGAGASTTLGSLFASDCSFDGGSGADGGTRNWNPSRATDGGSGASIHHTATLDWVGCSFASGGPGTPNATCSAPAQNGTETTPGVPADYEQPWSPRSLSATTPIRESQSTTLTFTGEPFDYVVLGAAASPVQLAFPPFLGPLLVGFPSVTFKFGLLPASGTKSITANVGLDPAADFAVLYLQAAHFSLSGDFVLGAPTALVVLDDAF